MKSRGRWLLGKFSGSRVVSYEDEAMASSFKQSQAIDAAEDLAAFEQMAEEVAAKRRRTTQALHEVAGASDEPAVPDFEVEGIQEIGSASTLMQQMVLRDLQRRLA
jgi:hypothetical protein